MQEKQIISQLKGLKTIKPAKDWAVLVKKDLLFEPLELQNIKEKNSFGESVFSFFAKPAFVVSSIVVVGLMIMGSLAYFGLQKQNYDLQAYVDSFAPQTEENKQAIAGLQDIQNKMDEVKAALVALKSSNNPKEILSVAGVVKNVAKNSQTAIEQIKNSNTNLSKQGQALASLVKESSQEIVNTTADLQVEMFKARLAELKTKTLTPEDQERLIAAEKYFNEGNIDSAITLIVRIGETN
ncbi:MAG: hypothetical protein PHY72_01530 [Candidatus Pacebacteria bacterium]|nr:hypothetical protein [Candidatus Paceibacterota bacterium]